MGSWRYQPVFVDEGGERIYGMCELHFDDSGHLDGWTESAVISPGGEDMDGLTKDIVRMLTDAYSWKPVRFSDIKQSTVFEPAISMDDRRNIADYVEHTAETFKRAPRPVTQ